MVIRVLQAWVTMTFGGQAMHVDELSMLQSCGVVGVMRCLKVRHDVRNAGIVLPTAGTCQRQGSTFVFIQHILKGASMKGSLDVGINRQLQVARSGVKGGASPHGDVTSQGFCG